MTSYIGGIVDIYCDIHWSTGGTTRRPKLACLCGRRKPCLRNLSLALTSPLTLWPLIISESLVSELTWLLVSLPEPATTPLYRYLGLGQSRKSRIRLIARAALCCRPVLVWCDGIDAIRRLLTVTWKLVISILQSSSTAAKTHGNRWRWLISWSAKAWSEGGLTASLSQPSAYCYHSKPQ